MHSFPLSPNCRRHCLDCGLHPGWHNTTGTQCSISMTLSAGDMIRFRLWRSANDSVLPDPLGMGMPPYHGSEWTLTATTINTGKTEVLGKMFFEDTCTAVCAAYHPSMLPRVWRPSPSFCARTVSGVTRFGAFHEHIGCVPCSSFFESEVRRGPFAIQPGNRCVCDTACLWFLYKR